MPILDPELHENLGHLKPNQNAGLLKRQSQELGLTFSPE